MRRTQRLRSVSVLSLIQARLLMRYLVSNGREVLTDEAYADIEVSACAGPHQPSLAFMPHCPFVFQLALQGLCLNCPCVLPAAFR